jgi:hypothetical protein
MREGTATQQHDPATRAATRPASLPRARRLPVMPPGIILTLTLVALMLRTLALTYMAPIPHASIVVHHHGDPQQALARIAFENFTTAGELDRLAADPRLPGDEQLVYRHAPLILAYSGQPPVTDDTFIGIYYRVSETASETITITTLQYFYFSSDESGGLLVRERLALFGRPLDRELIYRVTIIDGAVASAYYQAPGHNLIPFDYTGDVRPIFAVASDNHNFRPVWPSELEQPGDYKPIAPLPHPELEADPEHDPDFMALAAREALLEHGVWLSHYLYVEFINPVHDGIVTISARIQGRWYYLHSSVAGLTRPGYNRVGIHIGYAPRPEDIEEIRLIAYTRSSPAINVLSIYLYPGLNLLA